MIDGGPGQDTINGDLNSTISGGEGADEIVIASRYGSATTPALIRDFEPTQDRLRIDTTIGGVSTIGAPTLALQTAANGTDVEVVVNGVTAILLEGVTISDALAASIVTVPPQAGAPTTPPPDFNPITGTDNDDVLEGTSGPDEMNGGAGNDRVNGNDGNDIIISTAG